MSDKRTVFARFAREVAPNLQRFAGRLAHPDSDLAADLVQEAFVVAYQRYVDGRLKLGEGTQSYLMTMITRDFLQRVRSDKRIHWDDEVAHRTQDGRDSVDAMLEREALSHHWEEVLLQLPADQRACVVMVDIEEMSYQEASEALEIPIGTVRSRLNRARLKLAQLLTTRGVIQL